MTPVSRSKAFTLIELLLVIIIMGLVYSFVGNSFIKKQTVTETITVRNLPESIRKIGLEKAKLQIFGRECDKFLWLSGNSPIEVEAPLKIGKELETYSFDMYGELRKMEFGTIRIKNQTHKICMEFYLYNNGSTSSYVLQEGEKFYLYRPLQLQPEVFDSLSDAKESYLSYDLNPKY
jgi:prepilin-type N-terminal cleavage/methylation domain-containing protein